jgi:hypothetical protein
MVMVMRPPQAQRQVETELRAGTLPTRTVGDPGVQGAVMTGTQGMGVRTPWAAAVAEATWGFERVVHMPKGMMFIIGAKSLMVATGFFSALTMLEGRMARVDGATPKGHCMLAPMVTSCGMRPSPLSLVNGEYLIRGAYICWCPGPVRPEMFSPETISRSMNLFVKTIRRDFLTWRSGHT